MNQKISKPLSLRFFRDHWAILTVMVIHSAIWLWIYHYITPHGDYIDHWMQSRIWSMSYYEHPPMVALTIKAVTSIFGSTEMGLELSSLAFSLLTIALAYALGCNFFDRKAGVFIILMMEASPFFFAKAVSIQTEQPLVVFWMASIWVFYKYLKTGKNYWLIVLGLTTGLGALSKYTTILFYMSVFIYFTITRSKRSEWLNPWQYLGGLTSLAVFSPVLIWNIQNDWVSFKFQLAKGAVDEGIIFGRASLMFLLGVLAAYSIILVIWGYYRIGVYVRNCKLQTSSSLTHEFNSFLIVAAVVPIVFFVIALTRNEYHDPQWAVIAIISFYIWLGGESSRLWDQGKKGFLKVIFSSALLLNFVLFVLVFSISFMPELKVPYFRENIVEQIFDWDVTVKQVEEVLLEKGYEKIDYVIAPFYPLASQFALHLKSQPRTYSLDRTRRNLWSNPLDLNEQNTIAVCSKSCKLLHSRIGPVLGLKIEKLGEVNQEVTNVKRKVEFYRVTGKDYDLIDPHHREADYRILKHLGID
jgi:dolichol-phosphate mannosyltransferase